MVGLQLWAVIHYNFFSGDELVRRDIILEDTTLRDGEQAPGVAFSVQQKVAIFSALVEAGVRWIEAGIPVMGGDEVCALGQMLERKEEAMLVGWNRGVREDIQTTIDMGFEAVHIGLPTSTVHLRESIGKDRTWLLGAASDLVKYAKDRGCFVSISAEDVGRTEIGFLQDYAGAVYAAGADRLRLSDTIGILNPRSYAERVRAVGEAAPIDTQCHCHNDYGLAVANTLAGLEAGARYFHVCVNGMGERAGMPDLAQTVMALLDFNDVDVGVDMKKLWALARLVGDASKSPVGRWQPIVGENVFAHESGIHAKGVIKNSHTFEPFEPERVGGHRRLVAGKHSGRAVIEYILDNQGVHVDAERLGACLEVVRAESVRLGGSVPEPRVREVYEDLLVPGE